MKINSTKDSLVYDALFCINLMKWVYEISVQEGRDSCLTSNLSLLLTIDENIDYFLGKEFNKEYNHLRKIFELMTDADININIIYESLLCLWSISPTTPALSSRMKRHRTRSPIAPSSAVRLLPK